jgi:hypothetical protein
VLLVAVLIILPGCEEADEEVEALAIRFVVESTLSELIPDAPRVELVWNGPELVVVVIGTDCIMLVALLGTLSFGVVLENVDGADVGTEFSPSGRLVLRRALFRLDGTLEVVLWLEEILELGVSPFVVVNNMLVDRAL